MLPSAQEMADSSQQLGRASALVQIGFCGWQERIGHRSTVQFQRTVSWRKVQSLCCMNEARRRPTLALILSSARWMCRIRGGTGVTIGTICGVRIFICSGGISPRPASSSNSVHLAPISSLVRTKGSDISLIASRVPCIP